MTREDYEDRKQRLDEQHRAAIRLLEAAHRQQLRALDLIWMTTADVELALPRGSGKTPSSYRKTRTGSSPAAG